MRAAIVLQEIVYELKAVPVLLYGESFANVCS
jgi:hypothetical protein